VIDVQVSVAELDPTALVDKFEGARYEYVPESDRDHLPPGADGSEAGCPAGRARRTGEFDVS